MIFLRIICLQIFWLIVVMYGKAISPYIQIVTATIIVYLDYFTYKSRLSLKQYSFYILLFTLVGYLNDSSLIWLSLIANDSYQFGNLSLWIVFFIYYEHIFSKFSNLSIIKLSLLGGLAGALTYYSAAKLGAVMIISGMENQYLLSQFIFWSLFFPLSLRIYFSDYLFDDLLDKTIIFSFDKSGFCRHQKKFKEDLTKVNISQQKILVTGATAGIGAAAASSFSHLGAEVYITGRSLEKGLNFEKENPNSKFVSLDMANWYELFRFAKSCDVFDHVVFNAGSMPENYLENDHSVEFQCSSQLLGHYLLLNWLKDFKKLKPKARIVWVSSGGMYLKKLNLKSLFKNPNYEKVDTYANVKRAQVTLVEELSKIEKWNEYYIYSMHPGWVKTDGLKEALPKFYQLMKNRLRSPEEGADTILWCLLTFSPPASGFLYFDRKRVSPYISNKYSPTQLERKELLDELKRYQGSLGN